MMKKLALIKVYLKYLTRMVYILLIGTMFFSIGKQTNAFLTLVDSILEGEEVMTFESSNNAVTSIAYETQEAKIVFPVQNCNYYISNPYNGSAHPAIDIAGCPYNTPIYAARAGVVVTASTRHDNGLYVVVKHPDGTHSMYAHLASINVSVGQTVAAGTQVGGLGRTGYATGIHLDFSLWKGYPHQSASFSPWQWY